MTEINHESEARLSDPAILRVEAIIRLKIKDLIETNIQTKQKIGSYMDRNNISNEDIAVQECGLSIPTHLSSLQRQHLEDMYKTLKEIRANKFTGKCPGEECENLITVARFEAVPWARLCRDCQEKRERPIGAPRTPNFNRKPKVW